MVQCVPQHIARVHAQLEERLPRTVLGLEEGAEVPSRPLLLGNLEEANVHDVAEPVAVHAERPRAARLWLLLPQQQLSQVHEDDGSAVPGVPKRGGSLLQGREPDALAEAPEDRLLRVAHCLAEAALPCGPEPPAPVEHVVGAPRLLEL